MAVTDTSSATTATVIKIWRKRTQSLTETMSAESVLMMSESERSMPVTMMAGSNEVGGE
jgi:hypothetical protein